MAADGLVAELQGAQRGAFLVAADPLSDLGFARAGLTSLALRHQLGPWGLTASAENGRVLPGSYNPWNQNPLLSRVGDGMFRTGLAADRRFGPLDASLGASLLSESRTLLGARFDPGFGAKGAESLFLDLALGLDLGRQWRLGGAWRQGWTHARQAGTLAAGSRFASNAWSLDVTRAGLLQSGDSVALRLSQPLRVSSGGLNLLLPSAYSYDTGLATTDIRTINLSPKGREIDRELIWRGGLWGGALAASAYWRSDPGHFATTPDDYGMGLRWSAGF